MIDDILAGLFGEVVLGRLPRSRRLALLARLFFGILGAGLGIAGAVHFAIGSNPAGNLPMRAGMAALMVSLACFWFFNVALLRRWRWPGLLFAGSFVGLFLARILFGP